MTALVARSPLGSLDMNRAQAEQQATTAANGSRRRSARTAFGDDDELPFTKKSKGDGSVMAGTTTKMVEVKDKSSGSGTTQGKHAAGKSANGATKKAKKSYDEVDGGFSFRKKAKGKAATEAEPVPQPEEQSKVQEQEQSHKPEEPGPVAAPPKKKPRRTLPVTPERDGPEMVRKVRRSKRLSAETEQSHDPFAPAPKKIPIVEPIPEPPAVQVSTQPLPTEAEGSPAPEAVPQVLQVVKKRQSMKIAVPWAETPISRRNKELRKSSAEGHRRSSSGMRGQRASSLIDSGASSAIPHAEVQTGEFYKHIAQELTEPRRMRQLLVWCGHRALPEKPGASIKPAESQTIHAARVVQEELLAEYGNKSELSNWFDRQETTPATLVKRPNPRNITNATKLQELEAELARLQSEKHSWDDLLATTTKSSQPSPLPADPLDPTTIDASLLDPAQAEILHSLLAPQPQPTSTTITSSTPSSTQPIDMVTNIQSRVANVSKSLEFKIDLFADSLHRVEQYRLLGERVADRVLADGAKALEERERERKERVANVSGDGNGAGGRADSIDVLRALSRVGAAGSARDGKGR